MADHGVRAKAQSPRHRKQRLARNKGRFRPELYSEETLLQPFFGPGTQAGRRRKHAIARPVAMLTAVQPVPEVKPLPRFRKCHENVGEHALVLAALAREDE